MEKNETLQTVVAILIYRACQRTMCVKYLELHECCLTQRAALCRGLLCINFYCHNTSLHESTHPVTQITVGGKNACLAHIRLSLTPYKMPGTKLAFKRIFFVLDAWFCFNLCPVDSMKDLILLSTCKYL